ncbi:MAG: rhodanese-like domain-containing protein [Desulfovibrio sp.]|nr:rhodanese-like domain-containing protein [Desulfovibrio sp.]
MQISQSTQKTLLFFSGIFLLCVLETIAYRTFGNTTPATETQHRLSVQEARKYIAEHADVLIVDLRSPAEFAANHTSGAINMPLYKLRDMAPTLPSERPVLLVDVTNARTYLGIRVLRRLRPDIVHMHYVDGWMWGTFQ